MKILEVHTSCSCTASFYSKEPIKLNQKGFIELSSTRKQLKDIGKVVGVIKLDLKEAPFHKVEISFDK